MSMGEFFHFVYCLFFFPWLIGLCFRRDFRYEKLVNEKEAVYKPGSGRITAGYAPPAAVALSFLPAFLAIISLFSGWQAGLRSAGEMAMRLMVSPEVASPLTVGLLTRSLVTVLPDRAYTQEELELIFRHELRHVQRVDSSTKLFYTYCLALCWFYPPMWLVYRSATADLELSCDEMVLDRADDTRREQYARLLLSQAGDDRGFSTCLSGSAKALEHRLKSALHPKKRLEGTALVVLTMVALFLLSSLISVTGTYGTAKEVILDQLPGAYMTITPAERYDEEAVMAALEEVEVTWLRSGSLANGTRLDAYFHLRTEDERQRADFMFTEDGYLYVGVYADHSRDRADVGGLYRVEGDVDWEALKRKG